MGRYAHNLIQGLSLYARGWDVTTIRNTGRPPFSPLAPFTPWGRWQVARRTGRIGADVLHSLHLELPVTETTAIATIHDLIPLTHPASMPSRFRRRVFEQLVMDSLRRATRIIVPSSGVRTTLLGIGAAEEQVQVIPMAVSDVFSPLTDTERESARERFAGGDRYLAAVAANKAHKNLSVLDTAAAVVGERHGVRFLCRTSPSAARHLQMVPPLNDSELRLFYGGAECVVMSSVAEGFGLPVVEALACGTRSICSREIGAAQYLGKEALFVDEPSAQALVQAIDVALERSEVPGLRTSLDAGSQRIRRVLSIEEMTRATIAVYEEAVEVVT